jgi:hypothetical protein
LLDSLPDEIVQGDREYLLNEAVTLKHVAPLKAIVEHRKLTPVSSDVMARAQRLICTAGNAAQLKWMLDQPGGKEAANTPGWFGQTPLDIAMEHRHTECIDIVQTSRR